MPENGAQQAESGVQIDPFRAYNWKLEMQGVSEGHFVECSGLAAKAEVIRWREGGDSQIVRKLPGPIDYGSVTFMYGLTTSNELWDWFQSIVQGNVDRRNFSVVMLSTVGEEALRWNLLGAWPAQWKGAPLNALGQEAAIESVTFEFDGLEKG